MRRTKIHDTRRQNGEVPDATPTARNACESGHQERYQRNTPPFGHLMQGQPVAPELLALELQRPVEEVLAILRAHPELEYDERGNIVGSGLTLVSTAHRFQVNRHTLSGFYATRDFRAPEGGICPLYELRRKGGLSAQFLPLCGILSAELRARSRQKLRR